MTQSPKPAWMTDNAPLIAEMQRLSKQRDALLAAAQAVDEALANEGPLSQETHDALGLLAAAIAQAKGE